MTRAARMLSAMAALATVPRLSGSPGASFGHPDFVASYSNRVTSYSVFARARASPCGDAT